jgi:hypothetical protein
MLLMSSVQDKFTFVVGYHELEGSKVSLKNPLAVLKKKVVEDEMEIDSSDRSLRGSPGVEMEVVGIIRHKLLFKKRPKALISSESIFALYFRCLSSRKTGYADLFSNILDWVWPTTSSFMTYKPQLFASITSFATKKLPLLCDLLSTKYYYLCKMELEHSHIQSTE